MTNSANITFKMFKISGGQKSEQYTFEAMSDKHAIIIAQNFYEKCGLIGRYYIETSTGSNYSI